MVIIPEVDPLRASGHARRAKDSVHIFPSLKKGDEGEFNIETPVFLLLSLLKMAYYLAQYSFP